MKAKSLAPYVSVVVVVLSAALEGDLWPQSSNSPSSSSPPVAPIRPVTEDYYGTRVVDPYRYMENLKDPEVQAWMKGQNDYARSVLAKIPGREKLLARIRELDQSVPEVRAERLPGDLYLIMKRLPGEDVEKLYLRRGLNGEDKLLADPEKITVSAQGKGKNAIADYSISNNAQYLEVCITPGGSEPDTEVHVIEVVSGRETGDVILHAATNLSGCPSWLPNDESFVYGRLQELPPGAPPTEMFQKFRSYVHVLGQDPKKDRPVFGYGVVPSINVEPTLVARVLTSPGSKYAIGILNAGVARNSSYYIAPAEVVGKSDSWRKVADFSDLVSNIALHDDDLYLLTYKDAPRFKVIRTDARKPDLASAESVVPPGQAVIVNIRAAQDALYVRLLDGGVNRVLRVPYGPSPKLERVALPLEGTAFFGTDPRVPGAMFRVTSWTSAYKLYTYDPLTKQVTDTKIQPMGPYDNPSNIESVEVKARSYDGTMVPLSIVYPKGIRLDGTSPTILRGYGAYGISSPPIYDPTGLAWFERGGINAVCHVRGGGEYGEEWHLAGKGVTKPNTWLDFIACAQYLIDKKYTAPTHLAGMGASAGGILVGRAITERPDLFAAAVIRVGVLDNVRSENSANGPPNIPEFGSVKTEEGFKALYAMSAYQHVNDGTGYPAVLLTTAANDPRVDPWQPAKMTARLQAATSGGKPILLRVDYGGGHAGGSGQEQARELLADSYSFLLWQLGMPEFQPTQQVPPEIQPPPGARLLFQVRAKGDQVYSCKGDGAQFAWTLKAPDAQLFDKDGKPFGKHFAGPSWEANDGSRVTAKAVKIDPLNADSIPWLLVEIISHDGNGVLSPAKYIQRVNTKGGKAPASGCDASHADQEVRVPYSADYLFYAPE